MGILKEITDPPEAHPQFTGDFVDQCFYALGAKDGKAMLEN